MLIHIWIVKTSCKWLCDVGWMKSGCNSHLNATIISTCCHIMSFAIYFFTTCPSWLEEFVITCGIYDGKNLKNQLLIWKFLVL